MLAKRIIRLDIEFHSVGAHTLKALFPAFQLGVGVKSKFFFWGGGGGEGGGSNQVNEYQR